MAVTTIQSVSKRFAYSLTGNVLRSGVSFVTGILLARWLGPQDYGQISFLLASFVSFRILFDMSSSNAFFTFISRKQRSSRFIKYYWIWLGLQMLIPLACILLILPANVINMIWNGSPKSIIVLALIASSMQGLVWTASSQMAESQRQNQKVQGIAFAVGLTHLSVLVVLYLIGELAVPYVLAAIAIEWAIAAWLTARLYKPYSTIISEEEDEPDTFDRIKAEYIIYCRPVIFYGALTFLYEFSDRWMLQHWGGSREQAYFTVAQSFSSIALLATTSTLTIFWKEISAANHAGDRESVKAYYKKFIKILYFSATLLSCSLIPWYREIVHLLVGSSYSAGAISFLIMCLYPIHQTIGQVDGTLLYSTGNTSLKMKTTLWFTLTSLVFTYFTLAPKDALIPGFGLHSEGIALKMVIIQILYANIINWLISKKFNWKYEYLYQIYNLLIFISLAVVLYTFVNWILVESFSPILRMAISIFLYFVISLIIFFHFPWIAGITGDEMLRYLGGFLSKLKEDSSSKN